MNMVCKQIGIIHSPFKQQEGTPIQPKFAADNTGTVELLPEYTEGLSDLENFERIWLLCWLHRASEPQMKVIPYLDIEERGLFATRAPTRPNPIGISPVRLHRIDKNILYVSELDLLDGTPLLDIKPYSPEFDCFPHAKGGWLERSDKKQTSADGRFDEK